MLGAYDYPSTATPGVIDSQQQSEHDRWTIAISLSFVRMLCDLSIRRKAALKHHCSSGSFQ
jgi:hypothetical protein